MQKLLARPVVAPLFFIFGLVMSQIGYAYFRRGSFHFKPQNGAIQVISPSSQSSVYWATTLGLMSLGIVLLILSAYAALCLFRAARSDTRAISPLRRYGTFVFAMLIIFVVLINALMSRHASI
jgi:hypothetical protein